jgi:hypothetical protein
MAERVHGRLEQGPAQVAGAVFGQWATAIGFAGLPDLEAEPGLAGELLGGGEALDLADLGGDRERQHPADPRDGSTAAGRRDGRRGPA